MNTSLFMKKVLASRLLRPVFLILVVAGVLQVVVSQWLIARQVDTLVAAAGSALESSGRQMSDSFGETREDVRARLQAMREQTTAELAEELTRQQTDQRQRIAANVRAAVLAEAQGLADVLASVAAPLIWDRDIPRLTDLVELADARESVLFAVYFDQYGERMTRYVDRSDPRVRTLMEQGEGHGAASRVLDAAARDPNVVIVTADIKPQGSSIGQLKLGLSLEGINRDLETLEQEFSATIENSINALRNTLDAETEQVNQRLQQQLASMDGVAGIGLPKPSRHWRRKPEPVQYPVLAGGRLHPGVDPAGGGGAWRRGAAPGAAAEPCHLGDCRWRGGSHPPGVVAGQG